jgi:hypothetical protein
MAIGIVLLSVVLSMIFGGKIERLLNLNFQRLEIIVIAILIQYAVVLSSTAGLDLFVGTVNYVLAASYLLLIIGLWLNRHIPSMWIIIIGVMLNTFVIIANGGRMPVSTNALYAAGLEQSIPLLLQGNHIKHTLMTDKTILPFLGDILPLHRAYYPGGNVISIGDVILYLGVFSVIQRVMGKRKSRRGLPRHYREQKFL